MYLVLTTPNTSDSTVAVVSPRLITEHPFRALAVARQAYNDKDSDFINQVVIYKMDLWRVYSLADVLHGLDFIVFTAWRNPNCGDKWIEKFYNYELAAAAVAG